MCVGNYYCQVNYSTCTAVYTVYNYRNLTYTCICTRTCTYNHTMYIYLTTYIHVNVQYTLHMYHRGVAGLCHLQGSVEQLSPTHDLSL